jgi:hypothetical protein
MNANELADELDGFLKEQEQLPWGTKQVYLDQTAAMLRQQQAEIEALKYEKSSGVYDLAKTLTDEEIETIYLKTLNRFDFARAILKKAQEK